MYMQLPLLFDSEDAKNLWRHATSDAIRAYTVYFLTTQEGFTNKAIREFLRISTVYEVTHLKRCGSLSEEELTLWHNNPQSITLAHVRAVVSLPDSIRLGVLRDQLVHKRSSRSLEILARHYKKTGQFSEQTQDVDIKQFEKLISEQLGRPVSISHQKLKQDGQLTLSYFGLDDLDNLLTLLGYKAS